MKVALMVLVCLLAVTSAAQEADLSTAEQSVKSISLGKQGADGQIIDDVVVFGPGDIPIYCFVDLVTDMSAALKFELIAIRAGGLRMNSNIVTVSHTTKEGETGATFNATPKSRWEPGRYKADIFLNGKLAASVPFNVSVDRK